MVNKIILIGNLGSDPKQIGDTMVTISLATSEKYKNKDGEVKEKTEWHNVVIYNKHKAKFVSNYFRKGDKAYIEGSIRTREYEKNGERRFSTDVVIGNYDGDIKMLSSRDSN